MTRKKGDTRGTKPNRLGRVFVEASLPAPMVERLRAYAKEKGTPIGYAIQHFVEAGEEALDKELADA